MTPPEEDSTQSAHYVQVNGLNMYYVESGSGRPLILLHGGTVANSMWDPFVPLLASHFRVIRPDSRAHGRTNNPLGELSYRLMADDTAALCQALDLQEPLIFGWSDGGQIALEIGMNYPELAQALVVGGVYYRLEGTDYSFFKSAGLEGPDKVNFTQFETTQAGWLEMLQATHVGDDPNYWRTLLQQVSALWWAPLDYSFEDLQKIVEPTLVVLGDRDGIIPVQQAVDLYRMLPTAELAIIPNAVHRTTLNPISLQLVLDFLLRQ